MHLLTAAADLPLHRRLAEAGFESNDDYTHALRCLAEQPAGALRVLHVDGAAGRRKTAFAQALGRALGFDHVLYHDCSEPEPAAVAQPIELEDGSLGPAEPPLPRFERALTEACAYSESASVLLILDQLQAQPFADHVRLYRFAMEREWSSAAGTVQAHPGHLLLAVVSEGPLYHSLAKCAFRVWTDAQRAYLDYRPAEHGLGREAEPLFAALGALLQAIDASPTPSEFGLLLGDLLARVRGEEALRATLFGRIESLDRGRLLGPEAAAPLRGVIDELTRLLGGEQIELSAEG